MFKIVWQDAQEQVHTWRLDENWKNIIIGLVILLAVILDQVSHMLRNRKRTISAVSPPAAAPSTPASP
jgi:ribose transport system permease protein